MAADHSGSYPVEASDEFPEGFWTEAVVNEAVRYQQTKNRRAAFGNTISGALFHAALHGDVNIFNPSNIVSEPNAVLTDLSGSGYSSKAQLESYVRPFDLLNEKGRVALRREQGYASISCDDLMVGKTIDAEEVKTLKSKSANSKTRPIRKPGAAPHKRKRVALKQIPEPNSVLDPQAAESKSPPALTVVKVEMGAQTPHGPFPNLQVRARRGRPKGCKDKVRRKTPVRNPRSNVRDLKPRSLKRKGPAEKPCVGETVPAQEVAVKFVPSKGRPAAIASANKE